MPSTPQLLETVSRSVTPRSATAAISASGMPHKPNPPTARDEPSVMSATASSAVATTLSITAGLLAVAGGFAEIQLILINSGENTIAHAARKEHLATRDTVNSD